MYVKNDDPTLAGSCKWTADWEKMTKKETKISLLFICFKPSLLLKLPFDTSYGQFDCLFAKITLQNHLLHKQKRREKNDVKNSLFALV